MRNLYHVELSKYCSGKIIIDTAEISELYGTFETMAMKPDGEELDCWIAFDEQTAKADFDRLVMKYAEPMQRKMYGSGLEAGKKYTLFYLSEFGFPMAVKITFDSLFLMQYAQYDDAVKLIFKIYRKRGLYCEYLINNRSYLIFEGWQDLPENFGKVVEKETDRAVWTRSKYECFSNDYFADALNTLKNPAVIWFGCEQNSSGRKFA